jgi:hypothetical protein
VGASGGGRAGVGPSGGGRTCSRSIPPLRAWETDAAPAWVRVAATVRGGGGAVERRVRIRFEGETRSGM